ncbi:3-dehydroquinate synthase [Ornithinibacillus salinisoli]|uniref:3-dehydroquinate synthase n=1 Tax=Ornithinibacillus salinisoli TaxID=1848459 RepID=A0ABW4W4S7_9BACI
MDSILIHANTHTYPVYIGENIRFQLQELLPKSYDSILIITDDHVARLYLDDLSNSLEGSSVHTAIIPAGEQSKSIHSFYELHSQAIRYGLDRSSLIIALGGGVVGDVAGFVAATYMRGIDFVQVPTTVLAHDSSVGGKVAINHESGKNLIGNFYSPIMVLYDVSTLHTLPLKELRSGYAEIMKEAFLADEKLLWDVMELDLTHNDNYERIRHLEKGIQIKANTVEQDEKEAGKRKFLNLGHTLGHAIEAELGYGSITHGEAVAIGLLFAIDVSEKEYAINLHADKLFTWLTNNHYPLNMDNVCIEALLKRMKMDKKATNQRIQMVLLEEMSKPVLIEIEDTTLRSYIESFFAKLQNWYGH